jgi:hypothetical protein
MILAFTRGASSSRSSRSSISFGRGLSLTLILVWKSATGGWCKLMKTKRVDLERFVNCALSQFNWSLPFFQRGVAVECNGVHLLPQLNRVPSPATHLREGVPPVLKCFLRISVKFMIAERGVDTEMVVPPYLCLCPEYVVIIHHISTVRNVPCWLRISLTSGMSSFSINPRVGSFKLAAITRLTTGKLIDVSRKFDSPHT